MSSIKCLEISEFVVGIAAATLWFWSATIKVEFGHYGGMPETEQKKLALQARLNCGAALLTGIVAALQALVAVY